MTATARSVSAALLRAGLAAAVLAIIAGIFGMHVMTGNHGSHANHAATASVDRAHQGAGVHAVHAVHAGHAGAGATAAVSSSCAGSCQDAQEPGAACVPSANASSLTVFPPHDTGAYFRSVPAALSGRPGAYAFRPISPTPCELSISRT
ncbi:hypothetical protein [Arthrobacter sp. 754]|uniref:hypothetical protein n=1 Tax=Arthrobacter sp. 754 TaxID=3156315 RepID=UPI003391D3D3